MDFFSLLSEILLHQYGTTLIVSGYQNIPLVFTHTYPQWCWGMETRSLSFQTSPKLYHQYPPDSDGTRIGGTCLSYE